MKVYHVGYQVINETGKNRTAIININAESAQEAKEKAQAQRPKVLSVWSGGFR